MQRAVKTVTQVPQTLNVVHEHEEIIQQERPRMVARVVHEHAAGGVIHHGRKGVRQVGIVGEVIPWYFASLHDAASRFVHWLTVQVNMPIPLFLRGARQMSPSVTECH